MVELIFHIDGAITNFYAYTSMVRATIFDRIEGQLAV